MTVELADIIDWFLIPKTEAIDPWTVPAWNIEVAPNVELIGFSNVAFDTVWAELPTSNFPLKKLLAVPGTYKFHLPEPDVTSPKNP